MKYSRKCVCGAQEADFNFKDNILPPEVIRGLYCPACSEGIEFSPESSVVDNGWVLQFDMDVAQGCGARIAQAGLRITPGTLFDEGYATWLGVYPGDMADSIQERQEIVKLAKTNPIQYLERLRTWANSRMERLRDEGWRKAQEPRPVG